MSYQWVGLCREGESNPQGTKYRRILSSTVSSEPLGKFSTLFLNGLQEAQVVPL